MTNGERLLMRAILLVPVAMIVLMFVAIYLTAVNARNAQEKNPFMTTTVYQDPYTHVYTIDATINGEQTTIIVGQSNHGIDVELVP